MSDPVLPIDTRRLYDALFTVLENEFEAVITAWLAEHPFGVTTKGDLALRFEETVEEILWKDGSLESLQSHIGRWTMKAVMKQLTPDASSNDPEPEVRKALDIPPLDVKGREYYQQEVERLVADFDHNPASVASESRQLFERLFREMALVAASSKLSEVMVAVLKDGEIIKLPQAWGNRESLEVSSLQRNLNNVSTGDLGFFIILLGRTSDAVYRSGRPLPLLILKEESPVLHQLTQALTPHMHYRPEKDKGELKGVLMKLREVVGAMAQRSVIPKAAVLLECTESLFGRRYCGRGENGARITLRCDDVIPLGKRILFREVSNPIHRLDGWAEVAW